MGASPELRLEQLMKWQRITQARGLRTPTPETLRTIASLNTIDGDYEQAVEEWSETLGWLLHQLKMGVVDPVAQLPNKLLVPRAGTGTNGSRTVSSASESRFGGPSSPAELRLEALLEWRRRAIDAGRTEVAALTEKKLRLILRMPGHLAPDIARTLSVSPALAAEIANVLSDSVKQAPAPATDPRTQATPMSTPAKQAHANAAAPLQPVPASQTAGRSDTTPASPREAIRERRSAPVGVLLDLEPEDFDEFDYFDAPDTVHTIKVTGSLATGMTYGWPAYSAADGEVVVYRLVSNDEHQPWGPDKGDYIGATLDTRVGDARRYASAVRHVQVWTYVGLNVSDAIRQQPTLYANGALVSPVTELEIREDQGRVIGQWSVFEGIRAVQVYRIPIERAAFGGEEPRFRILTDLPNLGGFVDRGAERGKRYLYRVRAEATIDGTTRLSVHTQAETFVSALLEPVEDLSVVFGDGDDGERQFDLKWTTPSAGRVYVYRTVSGPTPGADAVPLAEGQLAGAGLPIESRLAHPISSDTASSSTMVDVPWPREWTRAYFTPVTVLDGRYQVGKTTSATRTERITHAEIVERVDKQILTFTWPAGAAAVLVYTGVRGQTADQGLSGQPTEISAGMYARFGGLHFPQRLPNGGCSLHMVPVAFAAGERIQGQYVTVDYPGMLRVFYDLDITRGSTGDPIVATIEIAAEKDTDGSPPFVLVNNPDRLPLGVRDGDAIDVARAGGTDRPAKMFSPPNGLTASRNGLKFQADVRGRTGFLRLFAHLPPERLGIFALLDPPVAKLVLSAGRRR
ncbi:hypothetical protein [Antrihabitans stalactiti]|uniref:Uncharacterized protein n=1 Tax=Antrihabitans stalactiti TaxID=2584121 RepID=A0A848KD21_9NOCA|nr:hypothetical protein [Antrihabitans stalactiti]NMN95064.1 hypothetical protein [Antrihabitans stalactiti]